MTAARDRARSERTLVLRVLAWTLIPIIVVVATATAAMWPRDDVPRDPDAIVVLGGAGQERADLGIELHRRYDAELVLSSSAQVFAANRGIECGPAAICLDPEPETTIGEARAIAELAAERGWDHVTVATTRFHTTRARVAFRQCLGDDVTVVGAIGRPRSQEFWLYLREAVATAATATVWRAC